MSCFVADAQCAKGPFQIGHLLKPSGLGQVIARTDGIRQCWIAVLQKGNDGVYRVQIILFEGHDAGYISIQHIASGGYLGK
ncbi:hypothetical protein D3C87_1832530 [compost metagenome]